MVGGGVAGMSVAYALSSRGVGVTVYDFPQEGQATAAGAGIVSYARSAAPSWWDTFFRAATRHLRRLAPLLLDEGGVDVGYRTVGEIVVAPDGGDARLSALESELRERQGASYDEQIGAVSRLTATEARELFPPLSPALSALYLTGVGRIDGRRLRDGLSAAVRRHGGRVIEGPVRLREEATRRVTVETDEGIRRPDIVIVAAGAWTRGLLEPLRLAVPVEPQRGQIIHLDADSATDAYPVLSGHGRDYIVTFPPNRVVCGATREDGTGFDYRTTAGGIEELLSRALTVAPGLSTAALREIRIGFRPSSPDGLPILGPVPGCPGLHVATGFGPSGLTLAPYAGSLVARAAVGLAEDEDGSPLGPVLARYSPARFGGSDRPTLPG